MAYKLRPKQSLSNRRDAILTFHRALGTASSMSQTAISGPASSSATTSAKHAKADGGRRIGGEATGSSRYGRLMLRLAAGSWRIDRMGPSRGSGTVFVTGSTLARPTKSGVDCRLYCFRSVQSCGHRSPEICTVLTLQTSTQDAQ